MVGDVAGSLRVWDRWRKIANFSRFSLMPWRCAALTGLNRREGFRPQSLRRGLRARVLCYIPATEHEIIRQA